MNDTSSTTTPDPHDPRLVVQNKRPWVVAQGDCLETLRAIPDGSVDVCVTDPPYGMSEDPDVRMMIRKWMLTEAKFDHKSRGGFMERKWDAFVPGPEVWKEVHRVLKPGGHLLAFCATRTWDLLSVAIRFAGFENRDTIACYGPPSVAWTHAQGFPKSMSIDKYIGKAYPRDPKTGKRVSKAGDVRTDQEVEALAQAWKGWGTGLKPSWEVVLVFRKPVVEKTVIEQVMQTGMGAINIDDARVGPVLGGASNQPAGADGRWPPNQVLVHGPACKRVGTRKVQRSEEDAGGVEEVEDWECMPGCPVAALDAMSGHTQSSDRVRVNVARNLYRFGGGMPDGIASSGYVDSGGASRFFPRFAFDEGEIEDEIAARMIGQAGSVAGAGTLDEKAGDGTWSNKDTTDCADQGGAEQFYPSFHWEPGEFERIFHYQAKISTRERNEGLPAGMENRHLTVKPSSLMRWLVRLVTPKRGIVLDPFCGSGTTGMASIWEGMRFIGCELDASSVEIARRRCQFAAVRPKR